MANPTDLQGMLTSQLLQPQAQAAIPSTYEQRMLQQGQKFATGLRRGIGAMTGSDTRTTAEKAQAMMANLDINDPNDQPKILQLVNSINPAQAPKLVAAFAQQKRQRDEKQSGVDQEAANRISLSTYVQEKYPELPQLAMLVQSGVVTAKNLKGFLPDATKGTPAQFGGSDKWVDEEGNYFYGTQVKDPRTKTTSTSLSPVDASGPTEPVGNVTPVGSSGETSAEKQARLIVF